jgi:hypothetical protein
MRTITLNWGTSKGKESEGQPIVSAYEYGRRVASAIGDGDLRGKVLGTVLKRSYPGRFTGDGETFDALVLEARKAGLGIALVSASAPRDVVVIEDHRTGESAAA